MPPPGAAQILIVGIQPDPSAILGKNKFNDRLAVQDMLLVNPQQIFVRQVTIPDIVGQDMRERLAGAFAETGPAHAGCAADAAICYGSFEEKLAQGSKIRRGAPEPIAAGARADQKTARGRWPAEYIQWCSH